MNKQIFGFKMQQTRCFYHYWLKRQVTVCAPNIVKEIVFKNLHSGPPKVVSGFNPLLNKKIQLFYYQRQRLLVFSIFIIFSPMTQEKYEKSFQHLKTKSLAGVEITLKISMFNEWPTVQFFTNIIFAHMLSIYKFLTFLKIMLETPGLWHFKAKELLIQKQKVSFYMTVTVLYYLG